MSAQPHAGHSHELHNPDVSHEHDDINVRALLWYGAILMAITVAIQGAMWGMFKGLEWYERRNEPYVSPLTEAPGRPWPEPGLQVTPWSDYRQFHAEQENRLHTYGWVDEKLGVARIPIAKAKEMLLQRGLPVRPELANELEGTNVAATGDSSGGRSLPGGTADKSAPTGGGGFVSPDAAVTPEPATAKPPAKPGGGL
ncbi:MAG TPA: hypothetical protein VD858_10130 [Reyranella sp.]|nr:hypothetical protein [Reyranella sp.]